MSKKLLLPILLLALVGLVSGCSGHRYHKGDCGGSCMKKCCAKEGAEKCPYMKGKCSGGCDKKDRSKCSKDDCKSCGRAECSAKKSGECSYKKKHGKK